MVKKYCLGWVNWNFWSKGSILIRNTGLLGNGWDNCSPIISISSFFSNYSNAIAEVLTPVSPSISHSEFPVWLMCLGSNDRFQRSLSLFCQFVKSSFRLIFKYYFASGLKLRIGTLGRVHTTLLQPRITVLKYILSALCNSLNFFIFM